jgi:hypothetical protein
MITSLGFRAVGFCRAAGKRAGRLRGRTGEGDTTDECGKTK